NCVKTLRAGGRDVHSCLGCGGICADVAQYRKMAAKEQATFGSLLPGAFAYPLRQNGPIILVSATIFFGFLDFARFMLLTVLLKLVGVFVISLWLAILIAIIISVGYLFAFMQNIVVSTANGEENVPG